MKKCKVCNNLVKRKTAKYCSIKCFHADSDRAQSLARKEVREKIKQTMLERYGVEHPSQKHNVVAFNQLADFGWLFINIQY